MKLQATGMEFTSKMIVKAVEMNLKIREIPITYYSRGGELELNAIKNAARYMSLMLKYKIFRGSY